MVMSSNGLVSLADIDAIAVPVPTGRYHAIPFNDMVEATLEAMATELQLYDPVMEFCTNKKQTQFFGTLSYQLDDPSARLALGLRQSYDKTLAPAVCAGSQIIVCDNLCFNGNALKFVKRNTKNVWDNWLHILEGTISQALEAYHGQQQDRLLMSGREISQDRGYELLGLAMGQGVIGPHVASVAFTDWDTPRHTEFEDRTIWSLYNCVTEGLKKSQPRDRIDIQTRNHEFFLAAASGVIDAECVEEVICG